MLNIQLTECYNTNKSVGSHASYNVSIIGIICTRTRDKRFLAAYEVACTYKGRTTHGSYYEEDACRPHIYLLNPRAFYFFAKQPKRFASIFLVSILLARSTDIFRGLLQSIDHSFFVATVYCIQT